MPASSERLPMKAQNIFDNLPSSLPEELFTTLVQAADLRVERIVSQGHASPPGFWCDQDDNELVVVLAGSAAIEFEGNAQVVKLGRSFYLNIPAHARHRVSSDRFAAEDSVAGDSLPGMTRGRAPAAASRTPSPSAAGIRLLPQQRPQRRLHGTVAPLPGRSPRISEPPPSTSRRR